MISACVMIYSIRYWTMVVVVARARRVTVRKRLTLVLVAPCVGISRESSHLVDEVGGEKDLLLIRVGRSAAMDILGDGSQ